MLKLMPQVTLTDAPLLSSLYRKRPEDLTHFFLIIVKSDSIL